MNMQEASRDFQTLVESNPEDIGSMFTRARESRGMDQRDVSVRLGLSLTTIKALEANDFDRLGPPVFVRGYLMRYSELLGLPERDILERYKMVAPRDPPPLRVSPTIKPQARMGDAAVRWFSYLLILGVVAYLGWLGLEQVTSHFEPSGTEDVGQPTGDGRDSLVLPPETGGAKPPQDDVTTQMTGDLEKRSVTPPERPVSAPDSPQSAPSEVVEESAVTGSRTAPESTDISPPVPDGTSLPVTGDVAVPLTDATVSTESQPDASPAASSDGTVELRMTFSEDCWVDVTDVDRNRLAYGVIQANSVETLNGKPPFRIILGNAVAVTMEMNGKTVDRSVYIPARGTVSRFTLGEATPQPTSQQRE